MLLDRGWDGEGITKEENIGDGEKNEKRKKALEGKTRIKRDRMRSVIIKDGERRGGL
jgi:hypothetical protein